MTAAVTATSVPRPPPVASATYDAAKPAATGAPIGIARKKPQPTIVATRSPKASRA